MATPKQKYDRAKTWQWRVRYMSLYHTYTLLPGRNGSVRKTAKYFKVSVGLVSENLRLAEHIDKLDGIGTRQEALEIVPKKGRGR